MTHAVRSFKHDQAHERAATAVLRRSLAPASPALTALVRAVTAPDAAALRDGWREWAAHGSVASADPGERALLPILAHRAARLDVDGPHADELRALRRRVALSNRRLVQEAIEAIDGLQGAGIDVLVLKGVALCHRDYRDPAARAMTDVDLLVREDDAEHALDVLARCSGARPVLSIPRRVLRAVHHGVNLQTPSGAGLDLHWHLLHEACFPGADAPFWKEATPLTIDGRELRTLSHADTLLHVLCHGAGGHERSLVRWIADAVALIGGAGPALDWQRLVDQAARLHVVPIVESGLRQLRDVVGAPIPDPVLADLRAVPLTASDVRYYEGLVQRRHGLVATPAFYADDFWMRLGRGRGLSRALPCIAPYLAHRLGVPPERVPLALMRRLLGVR